MSDRAVDIIAEAMGQHRLEQGMRISRDERIEWWECLECGWDSGPFNIGSVDVELAKRAHQAEASLTALKRAGIVVVELPEPRLIANPVEDEPFEWETGIPDALVAAFVGPPEVFIDSDSLRPDQARSLAAALLAAADKAEEET